MNWKPITLKDLTELISSSTNEMSEELCILFKTNKVKPYKILCQRPSSSSVEDIYVVACNKNNLLIFDDVEEEFGIGVMSKEGILKDWILYGSLWIALNSLANPVRP